MKNIAIIGAGMTGLSLAYNLKGNNITIFDKSWRPGGRVSTRSNGEFLFDHGAHYLSKKNNNGQLKDLLEKLKIVKEKEINFANNYLNNEIIKKKILIGINGMNSIPKNIFAHLDINSKFNSRILKIEKNNDKYSLFTDKEKFSNFDFVLVCIPYLQAKELTYEFISFKDEHEPKYDPIYTIMLSYEKNNIINIDGGLNLHQDIGFFMKQNFKFPNLNSECWVLNLSADYTIKNLDTSSTNLEKKVISIFEKLFNINQKPIFKNTHRWLYAQTKISYNSLSKKNWLASKDSKVFISGDWVLGKNLNDAWNAGLNLSHYLKIIL